MLIHKLPTLPLVSIQIEIILGNQGLLAQILNFLLTVLGLVVCVLNTKFYCEEVHLAYSAQARAPHRWRPWYLVPAMAHRGPDQARM